MKETLPLSVAIISKNEASRIANTLASIVDIASEIIVIDAHSEDSTKDIAETFGAKVFTEEWKGYSLQKQSALEKCTSKWILFLDCDEVPDKNLLLAIAKVIKEDILDGAILNRKTVYINKKLKYSWTPDYKLRLVRKSVNPSWGKLTLHEELSINSTRIQHINGELLHYSYRDANDHYLKSISYAKIAAQSLFDSNHKFKTRNIIVNPLAQFIKLYFIHQGFRDGIRGFSAAFSSLFYTFLKYYFLWELYEESK